MESDVAACQTANSMIGIHNKKHGVHAETRHPPIHFVMLFKNGDLGSCIVKAGPHRRFQYLQINPVALCEMKFDSWVKIAIGGGD